MVSAQKTYTNIIPARQLTPKNASIAIGGKVLMAIGIRKAIKLVQIHCNKSAIPTPMAGRNSARYKFKVPPNPIPNPINCKMTGMDKTGTVLISTAAKMIASTNPINCVEIPASKLNFRPKRFEKIIVGMKVVQFTQAPIRLITVPEPGWIVLKKSGQ